MAPLVFLILLLIGIAFCYYMSYRGDKVKIFMENIINAEGRAIAGDIRNGVYDYEQIILPPYEDILLSFKKLTLENFLRAESIEYIKPYFKQ